MENYKNLSLGNMEGEVWADIIGYEGLYMISNMGRVKSLPKRWAAVGGRVIHRKEKILKQGIDTDGYLHVVLVKNKIRKTSKCHRLVAIAFIENPKNKKEINHVFGNKKDNRVPSLEWATSSENQKHAFKTGLQKAKSPWLGIFGKDNPCSTPILQFSISGKFIKRFHSLKDVQDQLGFNADYLSKKTKSNIPCNGYRWEFEKK